MQTDVNKNNLRSCAPSNHTPPYPFLSSLHHLFTSYYSSPSSPLFHSQGGFLGLFPSGFSWGNYFACLALRLSLSSLRNHNHNRARLIINIKYSLKNSIAVKMAGKGAGVDAEERAQVWFHPYSVLVVALILMASFAQSRRPLFLIPTDRPLILRRRWTVSQTPSFLVLVPRHENIHEAVLRPPFQMTSFPVITAMTRSGLKHPTTAMATSKRYAYHPP